jgi:DNA repair protein RecN
MLKNLYIKNFTLIDQLNIDFREGFSVISGETGAGKSIILGAIALLLGSRADSKQIKTGEKKCVIEAHFDLSRYDFEAFFTDNAIDFEPADTILRRELSDNGKSRAFINDSPVSLQAMRTLGEQLVDIHSQHQNLLLQQENFQLNVLDIIADNSPQLKEYTQAFELYKQTEKELEALKAQLIREREDEEYTRFRFEEISRAQLKKGMQDELEQEEQALSHSEEIKTALFDAEGRLNNDDNGIVSQMKVAVNSLRSIEKVYPKVSDVAERLESANIELKDIAAELSAFMEEIDFDPARLEDINRQLDTIYSLEQKFHVASVDELLDVQEQLRQKLNNIESGDDILNELQTKLDQQLVQTKELAARLTEQRTKAVRFVENEMKQRLAPLGIPNVRFAVTLAPKNMSADGSDSVQFMFSANKNAPMQPVGQVASGGEIARVMLSLKAMISGKTKLPTIIFDEIDTGVSGKIAQKMALIMQEMGNNERQVISITHLPQIAALGTSHYKVEKEDTPDGTRSRMRELSDNERIAEIAQMLSGADITEAALQNARDLLAANNSL